MVEALWGVEFVSSLEVFGYGVAVLETGRIFGGDSSFVFVGSYKIENEIIKANIKCTNDRKVLESIFGNLDEFNLVIEGAVNDREMILQGHLVENTQLRIGVKLSRRAELP
jgi:hypothetical protein